MNFRKLLIVLSVAVASSSYGVDTLEEITYLPVGESMTDGGRTYIEEPKISLELPSGWKAFHDPDMGITLSLKGKTERIRHGGEIYRVNPSFTVRTIYKSEPIDDIRAQSFKDNLLKFFTEKAPVEDFQILQDERIDFHGEKDALLVYSSYFFRADSSKQDLAWAVATSIDYEGKAEARYALVIKYGSIASALIILLMGLKLARSYRHRRILKNISKYDDEDDEVQEFSSSEVGKQIDLEEDDDDELDPVDSYEEDIDDLDDDYGKKSKRSKKKSKKKQPVVEYEDIDDLEDLDEELDLDDDGWAI
jgi:hypothetical protein